MHWAALFVWWAICGLVFFCLIRAEKAKRKEEMRMSFSAEEYFVHKELVEIVEGLPVEQLTEFERQLWAVVEQHRDPGASATEAEHMWSYVRSHLKKRREASAAEKSAKEAWEIVRNFSEK